MLQEDLTTARTLGADIRALRKARGLTLAGMAADLGRSVGWVSQVERDISEPSITDLRQIAELLKVPVSIFFGLANAPAEEAGHIVRRGNRRQIGSTAEGLIEELLSPDLTDEFEVVHSTFKSRSIFTDPVSRPTQEVGYLVSGRLELCIDGNEFLLNPGDSFRIRGETYRWRNRYSEPAVAIWVIAPPVY